MPLTLHPEVAPGFGPVLAGLAAAPKLAPDDVEGVRGMLNTMINAVAETIPADPEIESTTYETPSYDGHIVKITRLAVRETSSSPSSSTSPATSPPGSPGPAVLYAHGGGYIHGDATTWERYISSYIRESGIPFFAVEYRLAPEHPYPAALEDLYAALKWLHAQADTLGIDRARIATVGHSAGGGLAAGLGILARDRGISPAIAKQILIYPMLDDRNTSPRAAVDALTFWPTAWNVIGWRAYLGAEKAGGGEVSAYAAPARVESFEGLPKTYIDVGGLDIFRDECVAFAAGVARADVEVEVHVYPGLPHGFDLTPERLGPMERALRHRVAALKGV
ncbi:Alpha/Beta hydrolase protein [Aspergillus carlsbadensis]|nr:Alpha/Beta hydrolase protein [Aspergillus carlsbadensis]